MEAYPLPDSLAKTVAKALVDGFFSRFGVPFWLKSDNGPQFKSDLFKELCILLEVEPRKSTAFHPQGNSRAERMVKVVGNLLASFCTSQKRWDEQLPLLTLAYRSTIHETTGYTPNYLMLGREVFLPRDIMIGVIPEDQRQIAPTFVAELQERMAGCFQEVRQNMKAQGERAKRYYNLKTREEELKPGEAVYMVEMLRKVGVSPKLADKWKGPYMVVQKCGSVYEVQLNTKTSKLIHYDLLKRCHSETLPGWMQRARRKLAG